MKRLITAILVAAFVAYQAAFQISYAKVGALKEGEQSELEWLRHEFSMSDSQFEEVKRLHGSHDEVCLAYCAEMDQLNAKLLRLMKEGTEVTPEIEAAIAESARLRERCRRTTLEHIYSVSAAMSPEAGQRYREMMTGRLVDMPWHQHMEHDMAESHDLHP